MRQPNSPDPAADEQRIASARAQARRDGPLRRRIVTVYGEAARDWRRAPDRIAQGLRGARELASWERRFAGDMVHELVRMRRRLELFAGSDDPERLLDALLAGDPPDAGERLAAIADPRARLAVGASYPDWLVARFCDALGEERTGHLLAAMNRRAPLTVRANRRKGDRAALAAWLGDLGIATHPTEIARDGLVIETRRNVYEMEPFRAGWMELQDEGSQLIAELCAPPPRGRVVDACAGAGGKTLALAALLDNQGRVTALDPSERKLEELKRRARRAGLSNVRALAVPGEGPLPEAVRAAAPPGSADRVLVDAPCSGTGVLKRNPETRWRLAEREVAALSALQSRLCARFAELVAPGGRLIYATCSLLDCENREVAARFLAAHPGFEPVPAKEILGKPRALLLGDGDVLELSPDRTETDGFFAAVFRRRS